MGIMHAYYRIVVTSCLIHFTVTAVMTAAGSEAPKEFQVRQPVNEAFNAAAASAAVGLLVSAVQNSLQKHKAGAMGIFSRTGGTIAIFSAYFTLTS